MAADGPVAAAEELAQLVTFFLGDEEYAVEIAGVQEIIRMTEITRVPRAPDFVEGVCNLRGRIVPVLDLRKRFGLEPVPHGRKTRIIIVKMATRTVGLLVDAVAEVLRMPRQAIDPPPDLVVAGVDSTYVRGVGKLEHRLIILLDLERILAHHEARALGEFQP